MLLFEFECKLSSVFIYYSVILPYIGSLHIVYDDRDIEQPENRNELSALFI